MIRYAITFTIETPETEDAGVVLEAAEAALPDLIAHLDAVCINATNVDDGTSPSVVEVSTCVEPLCKTRHDRTLAVGGDAYRQAQHERMLAKMRRDPASALSKDADPNRVHGPIVTVPITDGFARHARLVDSWNRHGARLDMGKRTHRLRGDKASLVGVWNVARVRCAGLGPFDPMYRSLRAGMIAIERGLALVWRDDKRTRIKVPAHGPVEAVAPIGYWRKGTAGFSYHAETLVAVRVELRGVS